MRLFKMTMNSKKPVLVVLATSVVLLAFSVLTVLFMSRHSRKPGEDSTKIETRTGIIPIVLENPGFYGREKTGKLKYDEYKRKNRRTFMETNGKKPKISKKRKKGLTGRILSKLKLTETQKMQIAELRKEKYFQRKRQTKIRKLSKRISQSFQKNTSQRELLRLYEQKQVLKNQKAFTDFQYLLKIREILTPEQRKKFQALKRKYKTRSRKKI